MCIKLLTGKVLSGNVHTVVLGKNRTKRVKVKETMQELIKQVASDASVDEAVVEATYESLLASGLPNKSAEKELRRVYPKFISTDQDVRLEQIDILIEKQQSLRDLLKVQEACCKTDDSYMIGLYNGLAVALSVLTGEEPELKDLQRPEKA